MEGHKMEKFRMNKYIYGLFLLVFFLISGIKASAVAPAQDQNFASSSRSRLVDRKTINYTARLPRKPTCDDGKMYLFEMQPYEYTLASNAEPIASTALSIRPNLKVPYTEGRLYSKLVLGVKVDGQYVLITHPQYIINPELLAQNTKARKERPFHSLQGKDFCNLFMTNSNIDGVIRGNYTTAQVMNQDGDESAKNPYSRREKAASDAHPVTQRYYMLNASESAGIKAITQLLSKCAAGSSIENYIIGNEVNVRTWNYMAWTDWDHYVREYAQAFRVAYNAIKSKNANARVFVCIDQNWNRNRQPGHGEYYEYIDGKDFLAKFNALVSKEGNIDWGVAQHPYPVPLTYAKFWDMSGCPNGGYMAAQVSSGKMLTFQNLSVLTNYMQSSDMLNPKRKVRHIICSEIGLTNAQGADVQAAALYASYWAAKSNPYVEEIIYLLAYSEPQVDTRLSGQSQAVYNSFGTPQEATYEAWAKAFIGISNWSQVIR